MERLIAPPSYTGDESHTEKPYIVQSYAGENVYIAGSPSSIRYVVTGKETRDKFMILTSGGQPYPFPVPAHYHEYTHHDFLCVKGQLKVWLDGRCKILNPGDYACVAPGAVHAYQFLADHTEIYGIITPAGFEDMFRVFGRDYSAPLWPDIDHKKAGEGLKSGAKDAAGEHDVIPQPNYKYVDAEPLDDKEDGVLPGTQTGYYLRNGTGPSGVVGGTVVRQYVRAAESAGRFSLGTIEGSQHFETQVLSGGGFQFPEHDHSFYVNDGFLELKADGSEPTRMGPTEVAWLPAGTRFDIKPVSQYVKIYVYSQPGGLVDLLYEAGKETPHVPKNSFLPQDPAPFDRKELAQLESKFKFKLL